MQSTGARSLKDQNGFTTFELLVVLVILAIISTVALPGLRPSYRREVVSAKAQSVANWLEDARGEAIKDMLSCEVDLENSQNGIISITKTSTGCQSMGSLDLNKDGRISETISIKEFNGLSTVEFSPRGTVDGDIEFQISSSSESIKKCIRILSPIGLVRLGIKASEKCRYD